MKTAFLLLALPLAALAAEEANGGSSETVLKWVYSGLLIALVVWAWRRSVAPALAARGESIRRDLESARKMKAEADRRVQDIETRLGNLSNEVESFRSEAQRLIESEGQKILQETADQAARMQQRTEKEIETLTKGAVAAVRAEAAQQAVELARQKIAQGLPPEKHRELVSEFLRDLDRSKN